MNLLQQLPAHVVQTVRLARLAEFVQASAAGVPVDTVCLYFPSDKLDNIGLATGLAYPTKAERVRNNPKVGLLIENGPNEPVISIAGMGAVRDADLQANVIRYLAENGHSLRGDPGWPLAQKAVWYWSRIFVDVAPARVLWWENPGAMDGPPNRLVAPPGTKYPESDPAPKGPLSKAPTWQEVPWQNLAKEALGRNAPGHLSVIDEEGFPMPIGARDLKHAPEGFTMKIPKGVPWKITGKASLSFQGLETFVGTVDTQGGVTTMRVERSLPILPSMNSAKEIWEPSEENKEKMMKRVREEAARRGQPVPTVPMERPEITAGYRLRQAQSVKPTAPERGDGKATNTL
jgi:hypothetical protein